MSYQLDLGKEGLSMSFKDWEFKVLEYLWSIKPEGATSKQVLDNVLQSRREPTAGPLSSTSFRTWLRRAC